jgi:hypothetical protein
MKEGSQGALLEKPGKAAALGSQSMQAAPH